MKKRKNKKGFTIVELVIVIAVIAILAAVLIPTFSSLIKKAKISADTQLAKNMNTALTMAEAEGNTLDNFTDVIEAIEKAGFIVANLNPTADGMLYVWEMESNQILMVDANNGFEVVYQAKSLENTVIGETWFVICHDDETASAARNAGAVVTNISWQGDTHIAKDVDSFTDAVANARDGDAVVFSTTLTLDKPFTIDKNITIVSYDGSAIIKDNSMTISGSHEVKFQNITFEKPQNQSNNASSLYARDFGGSLILEGCTFKSPQWENIQVLPANGAEVIINNCMFIATEEDYSYKDGVKREGVERLLHIQNTTQSNITTSVTITNNTFIGCDYCLNSVIDVDFIEFNNLTVGENEFYANLADYEGNKPLTDLSDDKIYCCNGSENSYQQLQGTFILFTGEVKKAA